MFPQFAAVPLSAIRPCASYSAPVMSPVKHSARIHTCKVGVAAAGLPAVDAAVPAQAVGPPAPPAAAPPATSSPATSTAASPAAKARHLIVVPRSPRRPPPSGAA